jgi:hypothetical protein
MKIFKGLQNLWSFDNSLKDSVGRCDLTSPTNIAPSTDRFGNASSASTGGATIMVWFKAVSINKYQRVIDFGNDVAKDNNIVLSNLNLDPKVFFGTYNSSVTYGLNGISKMNVSEWVHLTATFTPTSATVYFNGILDATKIGMISENGNSLI